MIADADDGVGVHDVVDQRHVLVADALDVVLAEAVHQQRRALDRLDRGDPRPEHALQMVARRDRARGARGGDEGGEFCVRPSRGCGVEDALQRSARAQTMDEIVAVLAELVEHDVGRIAVQRRAGVVDLLDVALRARRADDVGGLGDPALEPVEALPAHVLRQHRDAAATEDAGDRDAAAAVVAGRGPDRAVPGRVELAGDDARRKAAVGGENLVGADHREPLAEREHDARGRAGQLRRQLDRAGRRGAVAARSVVEPVDAKEVQRMRRVRIDAGEALDDAGRDARRVLQLSERRQDDPRLAKAGERAPVDVAIDQTRFQPEPSHAFILGCGCAHDCGERRPDPRSRVAFEVMVKAE